MKITTLSVNNFRLLHNFKLYLEEDLSVIIGKNNSGKTSLLAALAKFLGSADQRRLTFDDISTEQRAPLCKLLVANSQADEELVYFDIGLVLAIEYSDMDDLSSVAKLITNLDPTDTGLVLDFRYELTGKALEELRNKWKVDGDGNIASAERFLRQNLVEALGKLRRRSKSTVSGASDVDLDTEKLSLDNVLSFKYVSARRDVTNKDNDQTLSSQAARIYRSLSKEPQSDAPIDEFKSRLREADTSFSAAYETIFSELISKVHKFGGVYAGESTIKIASTLQHRDILSSNTTVMYDQDTYDLPEAYNGLGYMNLISMIFEIDLLAREFFRPNSGKGAAISLLFIEEPEAHTHPQMQYVFIKNIRELLDTASHGLPSLQTILSTHSAHIVAQAEFDSVKYLRRSGQEVTARSLKTLAVQFASDKEEEARFRFLKQYLTLNRAEIFFADKVVLIEGDTERILLPAMMKKLDHAGVPKGVAPLLSQNVSIVEVGAHSKIYEKLIAFLGLQTLIITDIDSGYEEITPKKKKETHSCCPNSAEAQRTYNHSLMFYHGKDSSDISYFLGLTRDDKTCGTVNGKWSSVQKGLVFTAFQTEEAGYHARSFEDSFFSLNKALLEVGDSEFPSLTKKWLDKYLADEIDPLKFSESAVGRKPSLAIEVLLNSVPDASGDPFGNWKTPHYIEEGLKWLRGDYDA